MTRSEELSKEPKEIQDRLLAQGVVDIKFFWNTDTYWKYSSDTVKEQIIYLLNLYLNEEYKPLGYIGDRHLA